MSAFEDKDANVHMYVSALNKQHLSTPPHLLHQHLYIHSFLLILHV